jgi:hypothetical protein
MPGGGISGGSAFLLGPEGLKLNVPATLQLAVQAGSLPAGVEPGDLAIFTDPGTPAGDVGCGNASPTAGMCPGSDNQMLGSYYTVNGTMAAEIIHFSFQWVAAKSSPKSQSRVTSTGCKGGAGSAACVSFNTGICDPCQCADGQTCPNNDPSMCCSCPGGGSCPFNRMDLCGKCIDIPKGSSGSGGDAGSGGNYPCGNPGMWALTCPASAVSGGVCDGETPFTSYFTLSPTIATSGGMWTENLSTVSTTYKLDVMTCDVTMSINNANVGYTCTGTVNLKTLNGSAQQYCGGACNAGTSQACTLLSP